MKGENKFVKTILALSTKVIPKEESIIFFSSPTYSDSAKALYEYAREKKVDVKMVWLTKNDEEAILLRRRDIPAYNIYSREGVKVFLKSKLIIHTHMIFRVGGVIVKGNRQRYFYLTHGIPLKGKPNIVYNPEWMTRLIDRSITTSQLVQYIHASWLGIPLYRIEITGYPRNDVLLKPGSIGHAVRYLEKILGFELNNKITFLYTPTFRIYYSKRFKGGIRKVDGRPYDNILPFKDDEIKDLDNMLGRDNALLIIRYHPFEELYKIKVYRDKFNKLKNIFLLTSGMMNKLGISIYDILPSIDCLITDYSSIYFDYLLLDRPIIFHIYDIEDYFKSRGFIIDLQDFKDTTIFTPGEKTYTYNDFRDAISNIINRQDLYAKDRLRTLKLIHKYRDHKSSERVWRIVDQLLHN
ncbi:hypothetical protein DRN87_06250 [Candidatus Geothermarchaeota archaeon]|nr:MAG: hypothetical protein DRN87_06250 [Candidatus Geothermarchaeota archaeon]